MKLIIAGGRTLNPDVEFINSAINMFRLFDIKEIVHGGAMGVDRAGSNWGTLYTNAEVRCFPADWETHGNAAGPIRNAQMAAYADALLLIWDGESRGSANMRRQMEQLKKPIYEVILKRPV